MENKTHGFCCGISDRDFIFEVFSNGGFVQNAKSFLSSSERKACAAIAGQNEEKVCRSDNDQNTGT